MIKGRLLKGKKYAKLSLVVPTNESFGKLQRRVKKMPILAHFRPSSLEVIVYPSENIKYMVVDVIMIE